MLNIGLCISLNLRGVCCLHTPFGCSLTRIFRLCIHTPFILWFKFFLPRSPLLSYPPQSTDSSDTPHPQNLVVHVFRLLFPFQLSIPHTTLNIYLIYTYSSRVIFSAYKGWPGASRTNPQQIYIYARKENISTHLVLGASRCIWVTDRIHYSTTSQLSEILTIFPIRSKSRIQQMWIRSLHDGVKTSNSKLCHNPIDVKQEEKEERKTWLIRERLRTDGRESNSVQ